MNLLNTLTYIKEVCNAHPLVNESFIGSIYDINSRTDVKYATMSVQADTIARQASGKTDYNVYLYYADRIPSNDDREAILQVQTAAVNVMREILNYIKNYSDSIYIGSYTIHPFEQKFADETAGCWATVDIQTIDDIGDCSFDTSVIEEHFQNKVYLLENYYTKEEVDALLSSKQNTLIAGENITIEGNVISATGGSTLTAGDGIDIANNEISVDGTIARKTDIIDSYTKSEVNTLLASKQDNLTAGENIEIENNVISVPHDVTLENIQSPSDSTAINIGSNSGQTRDNIYITAWGNSADANIDLRGAGNDNEASSIYINSYGYSDANMQLVGGGETRSSQVDINASGYSDGVIQMRGGIENDKKSSIVITANGTEYSEIQITGGDENNLSHINIDSQRFTYNDNDVAVKPINDTFDSGDTVVLDDNHIYNGTNIATLTINGAGFTGDCLIQFTTGSTDPVVTITGVTFEDTPVFAINKYYEINIHNGHALWAEFTA